MWPDYKYPQYSQWLSRNMPEIHYCTSTQDCTGYTKFMLSDVNWETVLGRTNMKKEETKTNENKKIYLERDDGHDRAIINGDRLEPGDAFRIVDDEFRKIYLVVDISDAVEGVADEDTIYALEVVSAKVVAMSKDIKAYVYNPDYIKFKTGEFIKDYGKKEINV